MPPSNLNAFDDWADTNKLFVRSDDSRRVAEAYVAWWPAAKGKSLIATELPDTPFDGLVWAKGVVAPSFGGFATLITSAALLTRDEVSSLSEHLSRSLGTLVVAAPAALEGLPSNYAIHEAGQPVFAQDASNDTGEMIVKTRGEAWLASQNIRQPTGSAASAWVFEDISQAIGLRVWEFSTREKHTYYSMDEKV
jgi:hypothetical protein